ncbi:MAG TPA: carbohydrate kinase family protein [Bacteroidota bacterium]|nr:carbohydrate kinase family protein [Bacteroidota bacterium]
MVITVIGHICKDFLHLTDEQGKDTAQETFGGIMYSILTLANLMGEKDILQPVFCIGQADYDSLMERLTPYKNIDTSGIYKFRGQTNQVHLFCQKETDARIECSKNIAQPIPFNRIKPYLDGDGVLINMISGSDITLETLDYIRMEVREKRMPIHFDFHSLTLGIDNEFKRFPRPLTDWRRWCFMLSSIQMNETEIAGLSAERYDEATIINHLMPLMVETLLITRGHHGATAIVQDIHKKLTRQDFAGIPIERPVNTIGCGDVFGAAFFYYYLKTNNSFVAAEFANKAAALNAGFANIDDLDELKKKLEKTTADSKSSAGK